MKSSHCPRWLIRSGLLIMLAASVGFLLAACGASDESVVAANAEPVTLNLTTWSGTIWGRAEAAAIKQFTAAHPQFHIETQDRNWGLAELLKQSPPPDLVAVEVSYELNRLFRQHQFANLNELWTQTGLAETLPASLQQLSVFEGNQVYLPLAGNWVAIYYNKAVFDQYQLTPPQTWDEFLLVGDTLLANDVTPLTLDQGPWEGMLWFTYLNLRLNGADFQRDLMQGRIPFDDARVRTVFERWRDLLARGYFGEQTRGMSSLASLGALIRGDKGQLGQQKAAMTLTESWDLDVLTEKFIGELDFFRFPVIDPALPVAEIVWLYGYAAPTGAEDTAAALELMSYMSDVAAQTTLAQALGSTVTPLNPQVDPARLKPGQIKGRELLWNAADAVLDPAVALPAVFWSSFEAAFRIFMDKQNDLDKILQRLEEGRQAALKQGLFLNE